MLFRYQAYDDKTCFIPQLAEASVPIEVVKAGTPVEKSTRPEFKAAVGQATSSGPPPEATGSLWLVFLGAFGGGVILNIMPCVLPVISLKVFGFMRQAGEGRRRVFLMGLVYAAGIMASFLALAIVMVALRSEAAVLNPRRVMS